MPARHCLSALAVTLAFALAPSFTRAGPLSYDEAWLRVHDGSDRIAAARAAVEHKAALAEGFRHLGGPSVSVFGSALRYSASLDVDLDPLNQRLAQLAGQLPIPLDQLPIPITLPSFPAKYTFRRSDSLAFAHVSAVWPIYLGGAAEAVRGVIAGQKAEAEADLAQTEHESAGTLAQRYFGAQLARRAAALRQTAVDTIARHDAAAQRMLQRGVISRVERLQAAAALEEARTNARKAANDAELAALALARLLKLPPAGDKPQPTTPLAVASQPLPPLNEFIGTAMNKHPGLAKVAAKKLQAEQLHEGSEALRRPQVFAFGQRELKDGRADWVAGIGVRVSLYDSLDHAALDRAGAAQIAQAEATDAQARSDIALLVEKQWRATEQARQQYLGMQAAIELARELMRLRTAGVREGTGTTLELIDAETNLAKVQTERAQVAYEYVMALAGLLQACGEPERLGEMLAAADIRIENER